MREKRAPRKGSRWRYVPLVVVLVVIVLVIWFPADSMLQAHKQQQEYCQALLNLHPVRVTIENRYDKPIWVNIEYSISGLATETWMIPEHSTQVLYTNQKFNAGQNVTITFHAVDPTTQRFLSDAALVIPLPESLRYDENYHKTLQETRSEGTTPVTIDFTCVTDEVFWGPNMTFG
jgi:hypothetical protein